MALMTHSEVMEHRALIRSLADHEASGSVMDQEDLLRLGELNKKLGVVVGAIPPAPTSLHESLRALDKAMGGVPVGKLVALNPDGTAKVEIL